VEANLDVRGASYQKESGINSSVCVSMSYWSSADKDVPRERIMTCSNGNVQKSSSVGHMTSNGTSAGLKTLPRNGMECDLFRQLGALFHHLRGSRQTSGTSAILLIRTVAGQAWRQGEHEHGASSQYSYAGWHYYGSDGAAARADSCVGLSGRGVCLRRLTGTRAPMGPVGRAPAERGRPGTPQSG
jgi:hypothetical protein